MPEREQLAAVAVAACEQAHLTITDRGPIASASPEQVRSSEHNLRRALGILVGLAHRPRDLGTAIMEMSPEAQSLLLSIAIIELRGVDWEPSA